MTTLHLLVGFAVAALPDTLTLDEAVAMAKDRQPALRQAQAQADAATSRARQTLAPVLPQVSAALTYSRSTANFSPRPGAVPSSVNTTTPTITFNSFDFFSANITAQATVWDFLQGFNRYRASLSTADAQEAQVHATQVTTVLNVRTAWHTARAQKDLVGVAQATLDNTEAHLKQIQGFVAVGTRPEIDLAQSKSERANARLAQVNAKNNYAVARARLNQAMGLDTPVTYDVVGDETAPVDVENAGNDALVKEAIDARPEAQALARQIMAQDYLNRSIRGAYLPTLGVQASGTLAAAQLSYIVPNVSVQATLGWQFWQGGLTNAQLAEGESIARQLQAQRDGLSLQVRVDVEVAQLGVSAAREAVDVAGESVDAARERLKLAEGRYRAGAGSSIELGDAQIAATNAEAQVVQAKANLAIARSQLLAALGRQ